MNEFTNTKYISQSMLHSLCTKDIGSRIKFDMSISWKVASPDNMKGYVIFVLILYVIFYYSYV